MTLFTIVIPLFMWQNTWHIINARGLLEGKKEEGKGRRKRGKEGRVAGRMEGSRRVTLIGLTKHFIGTVLLSGRV